MKKLRDQLPPDFKLVCPNDNHLTLK